MEKDSTYSLIMDQIVGITYPKLKPNEETMFWEKTGSPVYLVVANSISPILDEALGVRSRIVPF